MRVRSSYTKKTKNSYLQKKMVETDWTADGHFDNIINNFKALNGKLGVFYFFAAFTSDKRNH